MSFPRLFGATFAVAQLLFGQASVLTQHNDLARTGQNLSETILTPATVSTGNFGKLFTLSVDGTVEAQPLYLPALAIGGATHNVVFIATEHDSVYAFDADFGGTPLWQVTLLDAAHGASSGATSVPDTVSGCYIANYEYGISGTPVIDPLTGTLYVSSVTYENNFPVSRLHALDVKTGAEKFGGPVAITASVAGTGAGSSNGTLAFNPAEQNQRPGLAFVNGQVYVAFGAYCDLSNYHGWLFAYNAATLAQTAVFITSPNGMDSGIWMGAAAPSFDTQNGVTRMFITTGNGTFDAASPGAPNADYGDDILRIDLSSGINIVDYFTPYNQASLSTTDTDLGSSGLLILPDQPGAYPHLALEASKGGVIYLVNRDNLGGYSTSANNVVQEMDNQIGSTFGLPAYWNGNVYIWPSAGQLQQFSLTNGLLSSTPVAVSPQAQAKGLGSTPSISANGTSNAIVWTIDASQNPQVLYAHDATNVANLLWSSAANAVRDGAGQAIKFQFPTVANGRVFVSSMGQVAVYGLPDFSLTPASSSVSATQGQTSTATINIAPLYGFTGAVSFSASNLPTGVTASFTTTGASAVATFTAATTASLGNYSVTITGVSGTISHSINLALAIAAPPDFTITPALSSLTLSPGGSATVQINLGGTLVNPVNLSCSVAGTLVNVTCSIPATISGGFFAPVLTVTASAQAALPPFPPGNRMLLYLAATLLLASALLLINRRRYVGACLATLTLACLTSCGGGASTASSFSGPVAESGLITVVGTSGTLSHSATVLVTVQ
jgi:hypothetical protein